MKLSRITLLSTVIALASLSTQAQQVQLPQSQVQQPTAGQPQAPQQEWTPPGIATLGQTASSRTDFTLSHSMLVLASKIDKDNEDLRRIIAGVNGVSVHSYRFADSGAYDPSVLRSVLQEYHAAGWMQLVGGHNKENGSGQTDLWVHFQNNAISDIAVLLARADQLSFISVSGSISPIDLLHLSGHFGIPKIEGGTTVPASNSHP